MSRAEMQAEIERLRRLVEELQKYRRWYVAGEFRVRRSVKKRNG